MPSYVIYFNVMLISHVRNLKENGRQQNVHARKNAHSLELFSNLSHAHTETLPQA